MEPGQPRRKTGDEPLPSQSDPQWLFRLLAHQSFDDVRDLNTCSFHARACIDDEISHPPLFLARQVPDEEKRRMADFVIDTSTGMEAARVQVADIIERLMGKQPE